MRYFLANIMWVISEFLLDALFFTVTLGSKIAVRGKAYQLEYARHEARRYERELERLQNKLAREIAEVTVRS